jgi:hypothetical protein
MPIPGGGIAMTREDPACRPPAASAAEASIDLERESVADSLLGWLALYVPTWGTSVLLHVTAIVLAVFMAWQIKADPVYEGYTVSPVRPTVPPNVTTRAVPRETPGDGQASHGKKTPDDSRFVFLHPDDVPGLGLDAALLDLHIIGIGSNLRGDGKEGLGDGPGRGGGTRVFTPSDDRKIVYVVDRSGSMTDSLDIVKLELKRSLFDLGADTEFHVIFFSSGPPVEMPARRLVAATDRNRGLAFEFIDGVIARGETDPSQALERAFAAKPDLIYLLTDGEFDRAIIDLVKRLNVGGKVRVYTIGFLYDGGREILTKIAADNGGEYKFVAEKDLADIVGS